MSRAVWLVSCGQRRPNHRLDDLMDRPLGPCNRIILLGYPIDDCPCGSLETTIHNGPLFLRGFRDVLDSVLPHVLQPVQTQADKLSRERPVTEIFSRDHQECFGFR